MRARFSLQVRWNHPTAENPAQARCALVACTVFRAERRESEAAEGATKEDRNREKKQCKTINHDFHETIDFTMKLRHCICAERPYVLFAYQVPDVA